MGGGTVVIGKPSLSAERGTSGMDTLLSKAEPLHKEGVTVVVVSVDSQAAALIGVGDPIKATSAEAIRTSTISSSQLRC